MIERNKYKLLFVSLLILGKDTAYRNLRSTISDMDDVESTWLGIEMDPSELITRIPPISMSHSLKYGSVARLRVRALERSGKTFDAAFFNHILVTPLLKKFRKRVPSIDAMDVTPASLLRDGQPYYESPRSGGGFTSREIKRILAKSVFKTAQHLLPQSEYTRESLLRDYGIAVEKTTVLAPGVNLEMWQGRPTGDTLRKENKSLNVLFVGGNFLRKGGDIVLRIAAREEYRNWQFHFVTKDDANIVLPNVTFHKNIAPNSNELRYLYQNADVFVLPTHADFAPTNSICEAMAMGLPVISTSVGGIQENVIDGKTGFIVPINGVEILEQRLLTLYHNTDFRMQMGRNARILAETKFDNAINARAIVELMKKGINKNYI